MGKRLVVSNNIQESEGFDGIYVYDPAKRIPREIAKDITKIIVPEGIKEIGDGAFSHLPNLTSVVIPEGVTKIGTKAFRYCTNLESITLPESLEEIGYCAFGECRNLKDINIPDNVKKIGGYAFSECAITDVVVPVGVDMIEAGTFAKCGDLESVKLLGRVKSIEYNAFGGCMNLKDVNLPDGLETIGHSAFRGCKSIKNPDFPDSLKSIGTNTYADCISIDTAILPSTLRELDDYAFDRNVRILTRVTEHDIEDNRTVDHISNIVNEAKTNGKLDIVDRYMKMAEAEMSGIKSDNGADQKAFDFC